MRRALLIGIDHYPNAPLGGCVADAERLAKLLESNEDGSPNFDCRLLLGERGSGGLSKARALDSVEQHLSREADSALLYFAGHGLITSRGGFLATSDARRHEEGIAMRDLLLLVNRSPIDDVTLLIDCCHSGGFGTVSGDGPEPASLREGVAVMMASGEDELSVESGRAGIFTSLVCDALRGQAADLLGRITVAGLYTHAEFQLGAWDQRPRFYANLKRLSVLRSTRPRVGRALLRKLPEFFASASASYALDPSCEPSSPTFERSRGDTFAELQQLAREGLVEPVDAPHMYGAAMSGKSCRLTAAGESYWLLASRRRI